MTSPQTDADTRAAFEANSFYGLDPADVVFFQQGTLPCFTHDGKILMETGSKVSCAPDGNGGIYHGLVVSVLAHPAQRCRVKSLGQLAPPPLPLK
jgi:UDP-N-acetylglucosamine/UDP-N-acetylgalactosamine diphosphorylase